MLASLAIPLARAAKTEKRFSSFVSPHDGHWGTSFALTRNSNRAEQVVHSYSYNGMAAIPRATA